MTSSNRINTKFLPSHINERPMQEILLMFEYLIFLYVLQDYNAIWSPELLFILAYHVYSLQVIV